MIRKLVILPAALVLVAAFAATTDAADGQLRATFVNIYSQCPTSPPSLVFCGDGEVVGFGKAHSTASLMAPPAPIGGTDCLSIVAVRHITLLDGSGSLTLDETGTLCPPTLQSGNNAVGGPYTVAKTYVIAAGTGVFAGASGAGSDINRSGGNSQVSVLSGSLELP